MAKKQNPKNIEYRIAKIHTVKFSFEDINDELMLDLFDGQDKLIFNLRTMLSVDQEKSMISIDIKTTLTERESNLLLIEHLGRTSFHIKDLDEIFDKEKKHINFPNDLKIAFYSLAYSHSRALLAVDLSPTMYKDNYFLPVVDPAIFENIGTIDKKK